MHHPMPCPPPSESACAQTKRVFKPGKPFTHLMADTEEELRAYAVSIGLKLSWIQHPGTNRVHFDVTGINLKKLLADPRVEKLDRDAWVKRAWPRGLSGDRNADT